MLLSVPIVVIVKVVAQHVEQLQPVAERLAESAVGGCGVCAPANGPDD